MLEKVMTLDRNRLAHTMVRFFISSGAAISYLDCLTARELLTTSEHTLHTHRLVSMSCLL